MDKYIKLDGIKKLINACEWRITLAKERHGEGFVDYSKQVLDADELAKRLSDLPIIEVSEDYIDRKKLLKQIEGQYGNGWHFVDIIRKAPSIVSDEDCISRKHMLEKAQKWKNMYPDSDTAREALTMLMNEIDNAPSVDPNRKKGKWVNASGTWSANETCSLCGKIVHEYNYNFCPNCGADMRGDKNDKRTSNRKIKMDV